MDSATRSRLRSIGREAIRQAAKSGRDMQDPGLSRLPVRVVRVNSGGTMDVDLGDESHPKLMEGIRYTTACSGAKAGDTVLLDTIGHVSYVTGILAR